MLVEQTHLRLVGALDEALTADRHVDRMRQDVARENVAAKSNLALNPTDPRWVVAVRAYSQLQGTTLTPERRRHIEQTAALLGVRPFEANVIMAVVQDHARHGRSLQDAAGTIALIGPPAVRQSTVWMAIALTVATAVGMAALAIRWLILA